MLAYSLRPHYRIPFVVPRETLLVAQKSNLFDAGGNDPECVAARTAPTRIDWLSVVAVRPELLACAGVDVNVNRTLANAARFFRLFHYLLQCRYQGS